MMKLVDLRVNHMERPAVDRLPYFSWKIESDKESVYQEAYRLKVRNGETVVWDSGKVSGRKQSFVLYDGEKLSSFREYRWEVTVWNNYGESDTAEGQFETAILQKSEWTAKWVECSTMPRESVETYLMGYCSRPVLFSREFQVGKKVKSAKVYATAHGAYRLTVNEERPDDREFAPEATVYDKRLYYQVYDVTELLHGGENFLEMYVADGWYFSKQIGPLMNDPADNYGIFYQMKVDYEDGETEWICSDGSEQCAYSYIEYADLFIGEKQDMRIKVSEKTPVTVKDYSPENLQVQPMPPVRPIKELAAKEIITTPEGDMVVDFGQVVAGRARIYLDLSKDAEVSFEYFEVLSAEGNYIKTGFAPQKDIVISGGKPFVHEAIFTYHGFRYIKVTGMEMPKAEDFRAVVLSTWKENTGDFKCSDERMNRLYQNIRWSQRNNMMSVPTDCPTREKAGWTGDILIYAKTAMLNEDMTPFLDSWMGSVRDNQFEDGVVTITSPYAQMYHTQTTVACQEFGDSSITGVAGWSDVIVWVPYDMYQATGNQEILKGNFAAMKAWCDYIIRTAEERRGYNEIPEEHDQYLWNTGFHFGEWLIPSRPGIEGKPFEICKETSYYIAPFYGYMTTSYMAEICEILEKTELGAYYRETAEHMKNAIIQGLFYADKLPKNLMGAYILAFAFGLVPDDLREEYKQRLLGLIEKNDGCLDTGFLATPYILDVLYEIGETERAYDILWQTKRPSWLYEVEHGATTIWEEWGADDAQINARSVSFDHYAFGCVDDWIFRHIAGIHMTESGYRSVVIEPDENTRLEWMYREIETEYGKISVKRDGDRLEVEIPCNTSAKVIWKGKTMECGSGRYVF